MTSVVALILAPFALLTFCFAVEVFVGLLPLRLTMAVAKEGTAVIIVPAHNEAAVIAATLRKLKEASDRASILVVADNCDDDTAEIARGLGINAVERSESKRRGKGYALDCARDHLSVEPPDVVVIVDADCSIEPSSISRLVDACLAEGLPCQAINLQRPSPEASPAVQLSTFAFYVKNVIRQRALKRLSGRAHLLGTGMALPWSIFAKAELATSSIVEDLKLGQELSDSGFPPVFVEQAQVWSRAETDANTISQRRRWEGGFLQNAIRTGPRLLLNAMLSADFPLVWAAIDLMIPPFALLILADLLVLVLAGLFVWMGLAELWPLLCLGGTLFGALFGLALIWVNGGSQFVSLRSLAQAPLYLAWKLPMYIGLARRGAPKDWTRTSR